MACVSELCISLKEDSMFYYDTSTRLGKKLIREGLTCRNTSVDLGEYITDNKLADWLYLMMDDSRVSTVHCRSLNHKSLMQFKNMYEDYGRAITLAQMLPYDRTEEESDLLRRFRECPSDFLIDKEV